MKAVSAKSSANDTLTRNRQGTNHKQAPVNSSVPAFPGSIPLIQRKSLCPCDGGCPRCSGIIQPKLTIGQPNDKYEQEADRIADQIMRMPEPEGSLVQRKSACPECLEEEDEVIQTKPLADQITPLGNLQTNQGQSQAPEVPSNIESRINSLKGGGQPLDETVRNFFEPRFNRDFSRVRLHADSQADTLNCALNARAFTFGNDILFRQGEYNPGSSIDMKLIAHELTHVVQQTGGLDQSQTGYNQPVKKTRPGKERSEKSTTSSKKRPGKQDSIGERAPQMTFIGTSKIQLSLPQISMPPTPNITNIPSTLIALIPQYRTLFRTTPSDRSIGQRVINEIIGIIDPGLVQYRAQNRTQNQPDIRNGAPEYCDVPSGAANSAQQTATGQPVSSTDAGFTYLYPGGTPRQYHVEIYPAAFLPQISDSELVRYLIGIIVHEFIHILQMRREQGSYQPTECFSIPCREFQAWLWQAENLSGLGIQHRTQSARQILSYLTQFYNRMPQQERQLPQNLHPYSRLMFEARLVECEHEIIQTPTNLINLLVCCFERLLFYYQQMSPAHLQPFRLRFRNVCQEMVRRNYSPNNPQCSWRPPSQPALPQIPPCPPP